MTPWWLVCSAPKLQAFHYAMECLQGKLNVQADGLFKLPLIADEGIDLEVEEQYEVAVTYEDVESRPLPEYNRWWDWLPWHPERTHHLFKALDCSHGRSVCVPAKHLSCTFQPWRLQYENIKLDVCHSGILL
ncbi:hypothetical protein NDU88_006885 [Pleurodeles waltl]|uniref:Uncharacterized protein n=1 Tax=Pleurodeles waltl TaxID=8319 RepID=A0AAV7UNJ2_PLEWA|nr:hypothetical protein NDU88_006885 [Pleurodeles waltl]